MYSELGPEACALNTSYLVSITTDAHEEGQHDKQVLNDAEYDEVDDSKEDIEIPDKVVKLRVLLNGLHAYTE